MKSLQDYILEAKNNPIKLQKDFAELMWKKKEDSEYGFPEALAFCKKVFAPKGHFDDVIYRPYEDNEAELKEYVKDENNKKEFEKVYQDVINMNFEKAYQTEIAQYYSLSRSGITAKIDLFVQIMFFALRKVHEKHNINLLSEKINLTYNK